MRAGVSLCLAVLAGLLGPAAAPAAADTALEFLRSPSGNIACLVAADGARCEIRSRTFKAPRRPATCELDWGSAVSVGKTNRRGAFACVGDTVRNPKATRLAFGRSVRIGGVRCTSRVDGIRCTNRFGRGFLLGRAAYRLF